jgi:iron complex outermembrane receptor protein
MRRKPGALLLPLLSVLGAAIPGAAAAQQRTTALEEVLVTAQHRTESAQSTPISLYTMNQEQLEKQRISGLGNLNTLVPNLTIDAFLANNQTLRVYIRGIGLSDTQITQDPAVGIYLDGAYIARSAGLTFDVADLERIEVLRGPQGALYGRNTTAGAIKLITRRPDTENLRFEQTISAGNNDLFSSKTSINLPFGDRYAAKLAYFYEDRDGFVNNDGPGGGFGDRESEGLRLDLRAEFTADLLVDYAYDRSKITSYNYTAQAVWPRESGGLDLLAIVGDIAQQYIDYADSRINSLATAVELLPTDTEIQGHTLNVEWAVTDDLTLRSISAYRTLDDKSYLDFGSGSTEDFRIDYNAAVIGANAGNQRLDIRAVRPHLDHEQYSQEFQLLGDVGDNFDFIVCAY